MNFLAHSFLSRDHHDEVLLGNFFGDSFKGIIDKVEPDQVRLGVRLHRSIDRYTDSHENVLKAIRIFREQQGMFSAVVVDMVFDHILAKSWDRWAKDELYDFTESVFSRINRNDHLIPPRGQIFYPHMSTHNWMLHYAKAEGLHRSLSGLDRRVRHDSNMAASLSVFNEKEEELVALFDDFFPQLIAHSEEFMREESDR